MSMGPIANVDVASGNAAPASEVARIADGALNPSARPPEPNMEFQLIELRKSFAMVFKAGVALMLGVLLLVVASLIYISAYHRVGDGPSIPETQDASLLLAHARVRNLVLLEKYATIRLMQVSFGMLIGFCCVFFGILLSWLGITAAYSLGGAGQSAGMKASLSLQSASPGLALLIGGLILTGISLSKRIDFQLPSETTPGGVSQPGYVYPSSSTVPVEPSASLETEPLLEGSSTFSLETSPLEAAVMGTPPPFAAPWTLECLVQMLNERKNYSYVFVIGDPYRWSINPAGTLSDEPVDSNRIGLTLTKALGQGREFDVVVSRLPLAQAQDLYDELGKAIAAN